MKALSIELEKEDLRDEQKKAVFDEILETAEIFKTAETSISKSSTRWIRAWDSLGWECDELKNMIAK